MRINIAQKKQKKALDIGAKTVMKTLKKWTKKNVGVSTTTDTLSLSESTDIIDAPRNNIVLFTEVTSNKFPGISLVIINKKHALTLIDLLKKKKIGSSKSIDKIGKSALVETTNLLSGSFMNALSKQSKLTLVSSIPSFITTKKIKHIVNYITKKSRKKSRKGVIFVNELVIKPYGIKIDLFLLFDKELLNILAKK